MTSILLLLKITMILMIKKNNVKYIRISLTINCQHTLNI